MKKLVLIVLVLFQTLTASDRIYLSEFITLISQVSNKTFVMSEEVDNIFLLDVNIDNLNKNDYFLMLKDLLNTYDLKIINKGKYYYIEPFLEDEKEQKRLQYLKLKHIEFTDIESFFKTEKDTNIIYIPNDKTLLYYDTDSNHERLKNIITKIDKLPPQLKLKVSVVETNIDKLKEFGSEITQSISFDSNFFFNLLAFPFTVDSELTASQTYSLNGYIKFLNTNEVSSSVSSPTITLYDNKSTSFTTGKNIPYSSGTTTISDDSTSTTSSTSYRDVGFTIDVLPKIYNSYALLDINITNETLLDSTDTPTTSKINLKQTLRLEKNKSFVLTGINQTQNISYDSSIPVLSNIPLIDWLFKYDNDEIIDSNLTIILELIDTSTVQKRDIKIDVPNINIKKKKVTNELTEHQKRVNKILGR